MTAYELAKEAHLRDDISHVFSIFDSIPEANDERRITVRLLAKVILDYWSKSRDWEYSKEIGTPKLLTKYKKVSIKKHNAERKRAYYFYRDIISQTKEPYRGIKPLSSATLIELTEYIESLLNMNITEEIENDRTSRKPNKNDIKEWIDDIFSHYNLSQKADFKLSLLPLI